SRQRVLPETISLLIDLANEIGLKEKIEGMFSGKIVNKTENRPALHTALRNLPSCPVYVDNKDVMIDINLVLDKIRNFSGDILSGARTGATGKKIKNILSIGIGGSYLGVDYLATALKKYAQKDMNLVFVSNVDRTDIFEKTQTLDPEETLVVVVSKTFTTAETMKNAESARDWLLGAIKDKVNDEKDIIKKHFVAVSTAEDKVKPFGIDPNNMFEFWDWVGGRYSATSAVGAVPLSLYLGFDTFKGILEGAYWMDKHFRESPFEKNIPVLSGLIDIWNINFLGLKTRALLPYAQALSKLPAHTQQVEMESNGKYVDNDGKSINYDTGEVIFGEAGTNGQHSFYQLIHQGTHAIPCDFIGFVNPLYPEPSAQRGVTHHEELMTNFFAQPDALAFGESNILRCRRFDGNRPSSSILLKELNPFTAGLLLALTEHRTVVKGFIWNIDSFDQWGVELGKVLGRKIRDEIISKHKDRKYIAEGGNPSTNIMLNAFLNKKLP
ncbi:TPA: glucose-6-phosphate isomerase, partial [bacterium]|nr:glucose-6-phosphate isomerase [bacterium]